MLLFLILSYFIQILSEPLSYPLIILPFQTKYIHEREDIGEDIPEDFDYEDYLPQEATLTPKDMIDRWFYNGIYSSIDIGDKEKEAYFFFDMIHSDFLIGKCEKITNELSDIVNKGYSFYFSDSESFTNNLEVKMESRSEQIFTLGYEQFILYKDFYFNKITIINDKLNKIEGLKFILNNDTKNDEPICGNIGLNIMNTDDIFNTNFLLQLKKKNLIDRYIWTLSYKTQQWGNIVIGSEPHLYDEENNFLSQYKTVYTFISKKNGINPWSINFNNIFIDTNGNNVLLSYKQAELFIDRGLIIGTEEYKKSIGKEFFNQYIAEGICFTELVSYLDYTKISKEYYIYYCDKEKFQGKDIKYSPIKSKPYFQFPILNFYHKELNYTFILNKENLFVNRGDKVFFLIIFSKLDNENNIWKLGEPFLSKYQLTFNIDQKTIGFYNPDLPKIPNSDYLKIIEATNNSKKENSNKNDSSSNKKTIYYIVVIIILFIILLSFAFYLGKVLNQKRKNRANELTDDNFEYFQDENKKKSINS